MLLCLPADQLDDLWIHRQIKTYARMHVHLCPCISVSIYIESSSSCCLSLSSESSDQLVHCVWSGSALNSLLTLLFFFVAAPVPIAIGIKPKEQCREYKWVIFLFNSELDRILIKNKGTKVPWQTCARGLQLSPTEPVQCNGKKSSGWREFSESFRPPCRMGLVVLSISKRHHP